MKRIFKKLGIFINAKCETICKCGACQRYRDHENELIYICPSCRSNYDNIIIEFWTIDPKRVKYTRTYTFIKLDYNGSNYDISCRLSFYEDMIKGFIDEEEDD